jgi:hypothetical protein
MAAYQELPNGQRCRSDSTKSTTSQHSPETTAKRTATWNLRAFRLVFGNDFLLVLFGSRQDVSGNDEIGFRSTDGARFDIRVSFGRIGDPPLLNAIQAENMRAVDF